MYMIYSKSKTTDEFITEQLERRCGSKFTLEWLTHDLECAIRYCRHFQDAHDKYVYVECRGEPIADADGLLGDGIGFRN